MQRDADRITKLFTRTIQRTVADFVKIGRELNTMKDTRYAYGAFERLFQDHATPLPNPIPFTHRYGTSFMALAKHPILSEAKYHAHLPIAIGTLRELARLESAVVLRAIEDGRIHPHMDRRDALALQPSPPRAPASPCRRPPARPRSKRSWRCSSDSGANIPTTASFSWQR